MAWQAPNLARARFENLRPVRRVAALLAFAAAGLTAWNVFTWLAAGAGAHEKTAELERLQSETTAARARIATLEHDLAGADLEAENRRAAYLNARIAERVFSWNLLLDRLIETMPPGVRLRQLSPEAARRGAAAAPEPETVALGISGEAENEEELLEFIDRLFANPRFGRPDLAREATRDGGLVQFELAVAYRPGAQGARAGTPRRRAPRAARRRAPDVVAGPGAGP